MNEIKLYGIDTHNLKHIDITIPKNAITVIYGRSGAGKSSLAFSSLYAVCVDEFDAIENGYNEVHQYKIEKYLGIIPAVSISQSIKNNNPRSTLYTYLNIPHILSSIKCKLPNQILDFEQLKIGSIRNECNYCLGIGEITTLLKSDMVIECCRIIDNPFKLWRKGNLSDFYYQLLITFCKDNDISIDKKFNALSKEQQDLLLYGKSKNKISFKCRINKRLTTKRAYFVGIISFAKQTQKDLRDYSIREICPKCKGSRINETLQYEKIFSLFTMKDFLLMSFNDLLEYIKNKEELMDLFKVIKPIVEMGLGYLHFSRSIPSLSGGELQKLRFSRLLHSNISGILLVIDEISSQLNENDLPLILEKIKELSKRNTVVLVEHSPFIIYNADHCIHIGPCAGSQGGYICSQESIRPISSSVQRNTITNWIMLKDLSKNNVISQNIIFPEKALTVIRGISGAGKSSLAKAIEQRENAIYISQKRTYFSSYSVLCHTLKLHLELAKFYANKLNLEEDEFLLHKKAGCKTCGGIGVIKYERRFEKDLYVTCSSCDGKLFDETNEHIFKEVNGICLFDCYQKEIGSLLHYFPQKIKLSKIISTLIELGLGHLQLNRKNRTLSGGEQRRIKLCEYFSRQTESNKILIIDEPIAGLDPETASKIAEFIYTKTKLFKAILVIEHRKEIIPYIDFEIGIGPYAGNNGGKIMYTRKVLSLTK